LDQGIVEEAELEKFKKKLIDGLLVSPDGEEGMCRDPLAKKIRGIVLVPLIN